MRRLLAFCAVLCIAAAALFALAASTEAQEPAQRHLELKQLMLELINDARRAAGAPDVRLGTNAAAQQHAEQMVDGCFHSHWGLDGLKPYMRYSLLGGYQSNAENAAQQDRWQPGSHPCAVPASIEAPDLEQLVRDAMTGWLNSPGHRRNLLDPSHRLVNVGIAWRGGADAYCGGYPVAAVVPHANWSYRSTTPNCVEPGLGGQRSDGSWINLPIIVAERWNGGETTFDIRADLSSVLRDYGAGVYTVKLSGEVAGARAALLEYTLFFGLYPLNSAWVYSAGPTTAAELFERLDLQAVFRWDGAAWRGYAEHRGAPLPGAADFAIGAGDWLWLTDLR